MDEFIVTDEAEAPIGVGPQLRAAREAKGMSLEQVAAQTRIPLRQLETIEAGAFSDLPGRTYAVGFSRTYAKTVGIDQDEVAAKVRAELDQQLSGESDRYSASSFEPGDPARVPSRSLGWFALFALVLLVAGGFFFFRAMFSPAGELPSLLAPDDAARAPLAHATQAAAAKPAPIDSAGAVVFTALEEGNWIKFYDARGRQLMQKQMAKGETYVVPQDADGPQVWTGRPDAFAITIGGRAVPKLAEDDVVMKDVSVTAEALLARQAPAAHAAGENPANPAT